MLNSKIKDYHIQRELGRGGMAVVYLAHDNKFDTQVAIKVLNKEYVHKENIRKRFLAEARNMFKMSHPNIIKVTDLIDEGDTVAFVMECIEGETLKEYLERKGKLTDDVIKDIFTQMLDAVGYVHKQNLVHRDIKPANFMLDREGKIKLLDFGIAKNTDANSAEYTQTSTGVQMGTPMYMSPEQISETKSVTAQSDIYSLGVVLWQMVAGRKPYDTQTLSNYKLQNKIVNEPLDNTNTQWDRFIRKATAKEITLRYNSAAAFKIGMDSDTVKNSRENEATVIENDAKRQTPPAQNSNRQEEPLSTSNSTAKNQNNNSGKAGKKNSPAKVLLNIMAATGLFFLVKDFISSDIWKEAEVVVDTANVIDTLPTGIADSNSTNLDFLKKFNGKYPYEVKLFENDLLTQRLKNMLGNNRYNFLTETWAVESPIKFVNNNFVATGCQAHNCGATNFIIVVDISKNLIFVGIREEEEVRVYSEDGSNSQEVAQWANENG